MIFQETCKHCQALRKEWYSNLEARGFSDIEKLSGDLKTTVHSLQASNEFITECRFQAKQSYYQWAAQKAEEAKFPTKKDEKIWKLHAEGQSLREIEPKVGLDYSSVSRRIKKLKSYLKEQAGMIVSSITFSQAINL